MRTLIIVARDSMLTDLEKLLHKNGVKTYSILSNVMGNGLTGRVYGTFLHPDINTVISAVLPTDQAQRTVRSLKTLLATRKQASQPDNPIPLKVFSFSCEEHM